jgi:hypothetical protein
MLDKTTILLSNNVVLSKFESSPLQKFHFKPRPPHKIYDVTRCEVNKVHKLLILNLNLAPNWISVIESIRFSN